MGENQRRMAGGSVVVCIAGRELRLQVTEFLGRCGLSILEAETGGELRRLGGREIVLVVADMPVQQAAKAVREAAWFKPELRTLLISSDPERINRELVPDPWIHFIEKPFAWCELGEKVARLLRPAPASAEARRTAPEPALAA
jgi:response regulator RpfG family c-di-GMP phosphodiesterase